jgi:hypothetical protein
MLAKYLQCRDAFKYIYAKGNEEELHLVLICCDPSVTYVVFHPWSLWRPKGPNSNGTHNKQGDLGHGTSIP